MVFVKLTKIQSISDPETGEEGRQIEFVEVRKTPTKVLTQTDESRIIQEMMNQLRMMGFPTIFKPEIRVPKMILFLSDEECEKLQINLEVNKTYDLRFWKGKMELNEVQSFD
ncbi:MAG: arcadin 1 [Candidatus Geothermarchaeales archaeon]